MRPVCFWHNWYTYAVLNNQNTFFLQNWNSNSFRPFWTRMRLVYFRQIPTIGISQEKSVLEKPIAIECAKHTNFQSSFQLVHLFVKYTYVCIYVKYRMYMYIYTYVHPWKACSSADKMSMSRQQTINTRTTKWVANNGRIAKDKRAALRGAGDPERRRETHRQDLLKAFKIF